MRTATCPSCGAAVRFRGATSIVAVCDFCRSTLLREGAKLEDIGKQADLLEDASPLQRGVEGRYNGVAFTLVGRIQYRYGAGLWNEWHLLFDSGKSGWLSDANGEYLISFLAPRVEVPAFEVLTPGQRIALHGAEYEVSDLEAAEVVAGEGELPFKVGAGWKAQVVDLRGERARFATIDYSDTPPLVYLGEAQPFDTFAFAGLRDPDRPRRMSAAARSFRCLGCGAPVEKTLATSEVFACGSCATVMDVTSPDVQLVQRNEQHQAAFTPTFPLGASGRLRGVDYEVVGVMRRSMTADGVVYRWQEYLLHNLEQGYLWVGESDGHYNVIQVAANRPSLRHAGKRPEAYYLRRSFRHFQRYAATVDYLAGEFNWRVKLGDQCAIDDYVAPPLILSSERTDNELTWSLGEYTPAQMLWQAFGLKKRVPVPASVAPNQPSPLEGIAGRYFKAFLWIAALAFVIQLALVLTTRTGALYQQAFTLQPGISGRYTSPVFKIPGFSPGPLRIDSSASVYNAWAGFEYRLVDVNSGKAYELSREVGYYAGSSGGESWTEGSQRDSAHLSSIPPGRYTLATQVQSDRAYRKPLTGKILVARTSPDWWNLLVLLGLAGAVPLVLWSRNRSFEGSRWAQSDYAPVSDDDDDD